jgi:hypothetical protein
MTTLSLFESFVYSFGYVLSTNPYREETMSRVEGSNRMTRSTKERTKTWHDKRMRKKECEWETRCS